MSTKGKDLSFVGSIALLKHALDRKTQLALNTAHHLVWQVLLYVVCSRREKGVSGSIDHIGKRVFL